MFQRSVITLLLLCPALFYGQTAANSVSVTVSRASAPVADQVNFNVYVAAPSSVTLDQVVAALSGTGITAANFSNLGTQYGGENQVLLQWGFALTVPIADLKSTVATLNGLALGLSTGNKGFSLSFNVSGTQSSTQSTPSCAVSDLLSDARAKAQKIATAASRSVGSVLSMSGDATNSCVLSVKFALGGF